MALWNLLVMCDRLATRGARNGIHVHCAYVQEFLEKAHEVSEMHIYTHGNAEYAIEMARLLDPTKRFFAERIISQV